MQTIDQDLLRQAQQGDESALAALIARMMPAIRKGAACATAPGLDFEDAVQEGLIGLFQAVKKYDAGQAVPFAAFADACIRHAQQDAQRAALRKKHAPLNFSVPLPEDDSAALPGPEETAIENERYAAVVNRMDTLLTTLERQALLLRLDGVSAAESARRLGCTPKAVANALARARRKLRGE
ncbi:MAG: sigma-70 family RNA polymerase sigma factor [Gemmiger sp.]